jgi:hypothetical protein
LVLLKTLFQGSTPSGSQEKILERRPITNNELPFVAPQLLFNAIIKNKSRSTPEWSQRKQLSQRKNGP